MITTKQYIYIGTGGALLFGFIVWRIARKRKLNKASREAGDYKKTTKKIPTNTPEMTINLTEVADSLALDLGVKNSIWNPKSWTENDSKVYQTLKYIPKELIEPLSLIYGNKYKRNLRNDLNELLDDNLYQKIKYLLY